MDLALEVYNGSFDRSDLMDGMYIDIVGIADLQLRGGVAG